MSRQLAIFTVVNFFLANKRHLKRKVKSAKLTVLSSLFPHLAFSFSFKMEGLLFYNKYKRHSFFLSNFLSFRRFRATLRDQACQISQHAL